MLLLCSPRPAGLYTFSSLSVQVRSAAQALVAMTATAAQAVGMAWLTSLCLPTKETHGTLIHTRTIYKYTSRAIC